MSTIRNIPMSLSTMMALRRLPPISGSGVAITGDNNFVQTQDTGLTLLTGSQNILLEANNQVGIYTGDNNTILSTGTTGNDARIVAGSNQLINADLGAGNDTAFVGGVNNTAVLNGGTGTNELSLEGTRRDYRMTVRNGVRIFVGSTNGNMITATNLSSLRFR